MPGPPSVSIASALWSNNGKYLRFFEVTRGESDASANACLNIANAVEKKDADEQGTEGIGEGEPELREDHSVWGSGPGDVFVAGKDGIILRHQP
jgi:hypothetical protein